MMSLCGRVVVSVSTLERLGLETYQRLVSVSSPKNCQRLGLVSVSGGRRLGLVLVSAIYVSCPRPIFGQIVQATVVTVRSVSGL